MYTIDENELKQLARKWAVVHQDHSGLIFLQGDLGSGKTTWVRHVLKYMGITESVTSPRLA